jgi:hypothetical protein
MLYRAWEHTLISRARFFWYGCAIVQSTDVALAYDMLAWQARVQPIPKLGLQYLGIHTAHPI